MDKTTIFGVLIGIGALLFGFYEEGGSIAALWKPTAFLIVFGGTLGAVMLATPMEQLRAIPKALKIAFLYRPHDALQTIDEMVDLAKIARTEGILAVDEKLETFEDPFFKNGMRLIVDGTDSKLARSMMETELDYMEQRHLRVIQPFEQAGGYAPTMGIIGTVMGLVHVLGSLDDVEGLGPKIATAFIATLYGVASANVIYLPLAAKLKSRNEQEMMVRELMIEGILSIQAGENPTVLRQKLRAFLSPEVRARAEAEAEAGDLHAGA